MNDPIPTIRNRALPLKGAPEDFDSLLKSIGNARFALIGEATHGTHDFYRIRAELTKRLIREKGFQAVAVEADWPDAYRVNRYVRGLDGDAEAIDSLEGFKRFPAWMWRNADVLDFIGWLRSYNDGLAEARRKVGFYGLDLYSMYASSEVVISYLSTVDPDAARRARERYSCLFLHGQDPQSYGYVARFDVTESCRKSIIAQLVDLNRHAMDYLNRDGVMAESELFSALQNARLVQNAEAYYRTMFEGTVSSWNLRDEHMFGTLEALSGFLGRESKIVVWEHNSHVGNARATDMRLRGEWNIGELVRDRYGAKSFLIGFTTYSGTVTAASSWDGPAERKKVRPALPNSYERLFHETGIPKFLLNFRDGGELTRALGDSLLERAIGVLYIPETERQSHYFHSRLPEQFDAVIHLDETRAIEPLEPTAMWERGEFPETYPTGI